MGEYALSGGGGGMLSWLNGVRGHVRYEYSYDGKRISYLPAQECANLRMAADLAVFMRNAYVEKCKSAPAGAVGMRRDVQKACLMVLREFDRVCSARGFVYMLYGGTLLGAQRHGGFIPWDDDIDVLVPREHYEKIIDAFNAESRIPSLRARLVSPSRGVVFIKIEAAEEPLVYIDVFPCDCYADAPGEALSQRMLDLRRRIGLRVLPDKNPEALYRYFAAMRNSMELTSVSHDSRECRSVIFDFDCGNIVVFDFKDFFPIARMDFEGLSLPVPANWVKMLVLFHGKDFGALPLHITNHFRCDSWSVERMLNIKRFLRADSLRCAPLPPGRIDMPGTWRSRALTRFRDLISPVFKVVTRNTVKVYHVFYKEFFRLRADRMLGGYLTAVEVYSRLIQGEMPARPAGGLQRQLQCESAEALAGTLRVCRMEGLACWLWLGGLRGAVRNGAFPAAEKEAVLLMPRTDYESFLPLMNARSALTGLRAERAFRYGGLATVVTEEGNPRVTVIPCDSCPDGWERGSYAKQMANAANRAAVESLKAENDLEGLYSHFAALRERMGIGLDIDGDSDGGASRSIFPGFDCPELFPQCHVLASKYYAPAEKGIFEGLDVPVPADCDMVLTSLYGDYAYLP